MVQWGRDMQQLYKTVMERLATLLYKPSTIYQRTELTTETGTGSDTRQVITTGNSERMSSYREARSRLIPRGDRARASRNWLSTMGFGRLDGRNRKGLRPLCFEETRRKSTARAALECWTERRPMIGDRCSISGDRSRDVRWTSEEAGVREIDILGTAGRNSTLR